MSSSRQQITQGAPCRNLLQISWEKVGVPLIIAGLTLATMSLLVEYLLPSVWCMQPTADGNYQVRYGKPQCSGKATR